MKYTGAVLDILGKHAIKAVFFVVGSRLREPENRDLVKRMLCEGHMVGNNSYSYVDLTTKSPNRICSEIAETQTVLEGLGVEEKLFRPPFGRVSEDVWEIARRLGYWGLGWNADTLDGSPEYKPSRWIARGKDQVRANKQNVVRLHDGNRTTAEGLEVFVEELRRTGCSYPWLFGNTVDASLGERLWSESRPGWVAMTGLPFLRPSEPAEPATGEPPAGNNSTGRKKAIFCLSKTQWDAAYALGNWDYLRGIEEVARYGAIFAFLLHTKTNDEILDVGCGEAVLLDYLGLCGYRRYVGVDISEVALKRNSPKADEKTQFVLADVESFDPVGAFSCIVFSECLQCFSDPVRVLERYRRCLRDGGVFIISVFISDARVPRLIRQIRSRYRCLEQIAFKNARGRWTCGLFANEAEPSRDIPILHSE